MAVIIEASYSKKLGLPQFSSHQFGITVRLELADLSQLESTNAELYSQLQRAVDSQIQHPGFMPSGSNGSEKSWNCTDRQRELILKLIEDQDLDKQQVDELARTRFGNGVRDLNRLQASGLIDELLEARPANGNSPSRRRGSMPTRRARQ